MAFDRNLNKTRPEESLARRNEVKFGLMEKATSLLGGIFLSPLIVSIILKLYPSFYGALIGTILAAMLAIFTFKKYSDKPVQKTIALGMLISIFFLLIGTGIFWIVIQFAYSGISG